MRENQGKNHLTAEAEQNTKKRSLIEPNPNPGT